MSRAQRKDRQALGALYERYFDRVYRYVLSRLGNVAEAEDLTEEVFVTMLHSISSFRWQGASFGAWLMRVAHNKLIDHFRRKGRLLEQTTEEMPEVVGPDDPAKEVEARFTAEFLSGAIRKLTPAQREVVAMRFAAGLSVAETAQSLGKSENNVKVLQFKGIQGLRRMMQNDPSAPSGRL